MAERERDSRGRPLNARPRDGLGRPLPRGAAGVARVPEDVALPPDAALTEAQRLLDDGLPFHAHEVLEASWKAAAPAERELWQGLAQLAAIASPPTPRPRPTTSTCRRCWPGPIPSSATAVLATPTRLRCRDCGVARHEPSLARFVQLV
jgi:hypothetical protein